MTDVTVSMSTATVVVTSPVSATVTTTIGSAVVNQNQATVTSNLQQVDTIESPSWIQFNTSGTASTGAGRLWGNDTNGTLEWGMKGGTVTQESGQELFALVKSSDGGTRATGQVVYITGSDGTNKLVALAQANDEPSSSKTFALMAETISGGSKGFCATFGLVRGLDTNALTEGAAVYLSPTVPGGLTATKPTQPNHAVFIGFCVRKNQNNGVIFCNIQNGFELNELHNVLITNPQNNDVLKYDSATGLWKNGQP